MINSSIEDNISEGLKSVDSDIRRSSLYSALSEKRIDIAEQIRNFALSEKDESLAELAVQVYLHISQFPPDFTREEKISAKVKSKNSFAELNQADWNYLEKNASFHLIEAFLDNVSARFPFESYLFLKSLFSNPDPRLREKVCKRAVETLDEEIFSHLIASVNDPDEIVRNAAFEAVFSADKELLKKNIEIALNSKNPEIRKLINTSEYFLKKLDDLKKAEPDISNQPATTAQAPAPVAVTISTPTPVPTTARTQTQTQTQKPTPAQTPEPVQKKSPAKPDTPPQVITSASAQSPAQSSATASALAQSPAQPLIPASTSAQTPTHPSTAASIPAFTDSKNSPSLSTAPFSPPPFSPSSLSHPLSSKTPSKLLSEPDLTGTVTSCLNSGLINQAPTENPTENTTTKSEMKTKHSLVEVSPANLSDPISIEPLCSDDRSYSKIPFQKQDLAQEQKLSQGQKFSQEQKIPQEHKPAQEQKISQSPASNLEQPSAARQINKNTSKTPAFSGVEIPERNDTVISLSSLDSVVQIFPSFITSPLSRFLAAESFEDKLTMLKSTIESVVGFLNYSFVQSYIHFAPRSSFNNQAVKEILNSHLLGPSCIRILHQLALSIKDAKGCSNFFTFQMAKTLSIPTEDNPLFALKDLFQMTTENQQKNIESISSDFGKILEKLLVSCIPILENKIILRLPPGAREPFIDLSGPKMKPLSMAHKPQAVLPMRQPCVLSKDRTAFLNLHPYFQYDGKGLNYTVPSPETCATLLQSLEIN
ncbi:MAG: hypothetical protein HQM10_09260 [Candidatus Riflebacteria bacterium]|nr:hypothetical protein [Candidatus Riflebacteria bacterium]